MVELDLLCGHQTLHIDLILDCLHDMNHFLLVVIEFVWTGHGMFYYTFIRRVKDDMDLPTLLQQVHKRQNETLNDVVFRDFIVFEYYSSANKNIAI